MISTHVKGLVVALVALSCSARPTAVSAAEIRVLCSNGIKTVMEELAPQFERATKHTLVVTFGQSAILKRQIEAGAPFDIAVLTPALIDDLIKQGKVVLETRTALARTAMALSIRVGAPKPDIGTTAALVKTLMAATSIASAREGAGGIYFNDLMARLGLVDALTPKMKLTVTGDEVSVAVARGEAALGVQPVSEILPAPGIEVLGTFPAEVQGYVVMVAGVSSSSSQGTAARELMRFVTAPAALPVIKKKGMEGA